jgi:ribosomal protein S18 acetylase RimI-like enzyme
VPNGIRIASPNDRDAVTQTVAAAFVEDPAFRYFFSDTDRFTEHVTAFAEYLFDKRVVHNSVWVSEQCEAVALWSPSSARAVANTLDIHALRVNLEDQVGVDASQRLQDYDAAIDAVLPEGDDYWYLGVLGLHPDHKGSGLGAAVMRAGLEHVRERGSTACLETSNPSNVGYYERAGWKQRGNITTPLPVWIFTYTPS